MKVISLNSEKLNSICKGLTQNIIDSNYTPDLILGVETGGVEVSKKIFFYFNSKDISLDFCKPIKQKVNNKKSKFKLLLKHLPIFMLDFLRKLEATFFFNRKQRGDYITIRFPADIKKYNKILIIDDALDSGETLKAVVSTLRNILPNSEIKSAVLTITKDSPSFYPDYFIFQNHTLLRFPWSIDAK